MKYLRNKELIRTIQVIFGLYLIATGLMSYFITLPAPPYNEAGLAFLGALFATGYMIHVVNAVFVAAGLMFLFNKWPAFGAVILAPIVLNILLFHLFIDLTGLGFASILIILNIYLAVVYWPRYRSVFAT